MWLLDLPVIYLVTPTYRRPEQIPDLTRLAQTLLNVPAVHWIVVEDNSALSPAIASLLKRYGIPHTHLKGRIDFKFINSIVKVNWQIASKSQRCAMSDFVLFLKSIILLKWTQQGPCMRVF